MHLKSEDAALPRSEGSKLRKPALVAFYNTIGKKPGCNFSNQLLTTGAVCLSAGIKLTINLFCFS